jgi:carbon-monoxide dehydrogenase medium subunit
MKAPAFDYVRVASLSEAFAALGQHGDGAKLIAGGQSLVPALNLRLLAPEILIDLNGVAELRGVTVVADRLRLGAMTRHVEIERSPLVREHAPLLTQAVRHVAHPAIRSRGTIGGNLAHADPASEFPACMVALEAEIVVASAAGERRIAAADFFTGVYETALGADDILVAVEIPMGQPGRRHAFIELARRVGDYALVGIACTGRWENGALTALRPVFFAAGPKPILARKAAACLVGAILNTDALAKAGEALADELEPEADLQITAAMRLHLARTLLRRALAALVPEAGLAQSTRVPA